MKRLLALTLLLLPSVVRAEGGRLDSWTVVGIRDAETPDIRAEVAALRGALSLELSARGRGVVRDEAGTRLRLGGPNTDLRAVRDRIDAAELYYFQLELDIARSNLEHALGELAHAGGTAAAWEQTRLARMLLGMVHLAYGTSEGRRMAREQFAAVARVQPEWTPPEASYPPEVIQLHARARAELRQGPRGTLRVICDPACPEGHVYVDNYPFSVAGEARPLPPGRYQVVVTDRFESPMSRSESREVEILPARETVVRLDLGIEGRFAVDEGPVLVLPADEQARLQAAARIARRLDVDRTVVLVATAGGGRKGWVFDREGRIDREVSLAVVGDDAAAELAQLVTSEALPGARPATASVGAPMVAESVSRREAPRSGSNGFWTTARWGSAGSAALAATLGIVLHADASSRDEALRRQIDGWGRSIPAASARQVRAEVDSIRSQQRWGNVALVGAGVLAATATTLFLLDLDDPRPVVEW